MRVQKKPSLFFQQRTCDYFKDFLKRKKKLFISYLFQRFLRKVDKNNKIHAIQIFG